MLCSSSSIISLYCLVVIIMARYKDSVSTTAHPTQAQECLRQKSSWTMTVNVRRYQNQEATIDEVDHADRDLPLFYADNLLENENLVDESGRMSQDPLLQTTVSAVMTVATSNKADPPTSIRRRSKSKRTPVAQLIAIANPNLGLQTSPNAKAFSDNKVTIKHQSCPENPH